MESSHAKKYGCEFQFSCMDLDIDFQSQVRSWTINL